MNRKRYTQEFKLSVVKEVLEVGNAAQVIIDDHMVKRVITGELA